MATRLVPAFMPFLESDGDLLAGGKLYFYEKGTTTAKDTFSDAELTTANTNPVVLGADGKPAVDIWGLGNYKLVVKDASDVSLKTFDPLDQAGVSNSVDTLSALQPVDISNLAANTLVYMKGRDAVGDGAEGWFILKTGDQSANVSVDEVTTNEGDGGIWIAPSSDKTGASGAWQRLYVTSVNVKWYGATGNGTTDDTTSLQAAVSAASGYMLVIPQGTYITTELDFSSFTGVVWCLGTLKAKAATAITDIIDFADTTDVAWYGGTIDFNQTASTVTGDTRSDHGFYMKDARDIRISGVTFTNIRVGEIVYIDGTSQVSATAAMGSRRIMVEGCSCVAFDYSTVDLGAAVYVRSDFYTDTNGGACYGASNATQLADYTLDATLAYDRTTQDVFFSDCYFENFDRIACFNVKNVHFTNCELVSFSTRGYIYSPSCENCTVSGGSISGNAAQVNINFACTDILISNVTALGEDSAVGQRHALRTGYGSKRIRFQNITGVGNDVAQIYVEGAQDVVFDNVSLNNWGGGNTTGGVAICAGEDGNTSSFVTKGIVLNNCYIASNYAIGVNSNPGVGDISGTATVAFRGITITNCFFDKGLEAFFGTQPTGGQIVWIGSYAEHYPGSTQDLDTRAFAIYDGGNINLRTWDTYACSGSDATATFSNVYFSITERDGNSGDSTRMPNILAYVKETGTTFYKPLLYGIDWDVSDASAANGMINSFDTITAGDFAAGDTIAIQRLR